MTSRFFDYFIDHIQYTFFKIFALQDLFPEGIDFCSLLIHHIVILNKVFSDIEVMGLNAFLGIFYRL